jgi:hypothetical protein
MISAAVFSQVSSIFCGSGFSRDALCFASELKGITT